MNILIVEDEARIASRLERMTRDILGDRLQSLMHIETLHEAMEFLEKNPLDIVLLDLNLNGESGFDLLKSVVAGSFHTIIVSAYKEKAIAAFEYGVLDFVPKPFNKERLEQAFSRAIGKDNKAINPARFLAVKKRNRIQIIPIEHVLYIKGAGSYTELYLTDGSKELHDKSLEKLEQLLAYLFERVHRSYLVKASEVKEIAVKTGSKYLAVLKNGVQIPVGRTKYKSLKAKWI
ncbi:MAG: LytTR family DNA-binding domain-containing protein [Ekhidna sp.]|uniref:LytR/AlgR family response regulator transcription factor n=1 Tax=Ekhidna sp. TaxID=2608089 RepID=UPI0032ED0326